MLNDIEVLDRPDDNYWMKVAYTIPDTPRADMRPGQTGIKTVPINRMVPRSFITNIKPGESVHAGAPTLLRGIAFGGDTGVERVDTSSDGGTSWRPARLGPDAGKYGFRRWESSVTFPAKGPYTLMVRCANSNGVVQPDRPNWNPTGFMRNVIESTPVVAG
jgi:hypothetical protein